MGLPTGPTMKRESLSVLYALTYMHPAPSFHSENRFDFGHDVTVLQSPESRDLQGLSCRENPRVLRRRLAQARVEDGRQRKEAIVE